MRENVGEEVEGKLEDTWFSESAEASTAAFLMKVSGGRHSGANLPLVPGKYSLGQDQDCDFIFLDDAFLGGRILLDVTGAKPVLEVTGSTKASVGGKPMASATQPLEPFEYVEVGATRFALGPAGTPWPEAPKPPPAETAADAAAETAPDGDDKAAPGGKSEAQAPRSAASASGC